MNIPSDLPGGWDFNQPFKPTELKAGQVWRKAGPIDAIKIIRVMQPGHKEHDGGAEGISVVSTKIGSKGVIWGRRSWFRLGDQSQIHQFFNEHGYSLAN